MIAPVKIYHLNCGTMVPAAGALIRAPGQAASGPCRLVCHVLLIETEAGLVLVDSGIGLADIANANARLGGAFVYGVRPKLDAGETARRQVEALGYAADDVRHIVLTHLDVDHAGGLADFPKARVHVLASEHAAAQAGRTLIEKQRYRGGIQWSHPVDWALQQTDGEAWQGFPAARDLPGLAPEILMIPLAGHTRGHAGVAIDTGAGWLLHAGDAYFHHRQLAAHPACPIGLKAFQRLMCVDNAQRAGNVARLRTLALDASADVRILCAHDPFDLEPHGP